MDRGKRSEPEDDTLESEDVDATSDGDGASSGDGSVLRRRAAPDASEEETEPRKGRPAPGDGGGSSMGTVLVGVTLAFVIFSSLGFYYNASSHGNDVDPEWITEQLTKNVRVVRSGFPAQSKAMWAELYSGVQRVLLEKPTEPVVVLLVHRSGGPGEVARCLARKVAGFVHALLRPSLEDVLSLDGGKVGAITVEKYRPLVEGHGVVVLRDLQSVPPRHAAGLRAFCNKNKPLVDRAVYILTLSISEDDGTSPKEVAENELTELWGEMGMAAVGPLVKCLTGGHIFRIVAEKNPVEGC